MIRLESVHYSAGEFRMENISFTVPTGHYGVLMGRTGTGKTSLIELICGLRSVRLGSIIVQDRDVTNEPPGKRRIGYVPQDGALFPTMTVRDQIGFAPRLQGSPLAERTSLIHELAESVGVTHLLDRKPHGLSGGEKQRIALARALAARPSVLLLDEPLAALDEDTHGEMMALLKSTQKKFHLTVLHVTHQMKEAAELADVILRLENGAVREITPTQPISTLLNPKPDIEGIETRLLH